MRTVLAFVIAAGSLGVTQTIVPVEREPQHRLAFENEYVKVLDVLFPPGYMSLFHQHSVDNVAIRISGGTTRTDQLAAEGSPQDVPPGRVTFLSGTPPYTHRVANLGTTAVQIVDVELVGTKSTPDDRAVDDLIRHVIVIGPENERVRVSRIQLSPGESLPSHTHQRGWLEVVIAGPKPGQFTWHAGGTRMAAVTASPSRPLEIVEVEPK
jgi:predicted metal-dependent enzyme (double-stranded beta helix superfamily)